MQNEPVWGALTYLLAPTLGYYASMGTQIDADNICYGTGWVRGARATVLISPRGNFPFAGGNLPSLFY